MKTITGRSKEIAIRVYFCLLGGMTPYEASRRLKIRPATCYRHFRRLRELREMTIPISPAPLPPLSPEGAPSPPCSPTPNAQYRIPNMTETEAIKLQQSGEPVFYRGKYACLKNIPFYIQRLSKQGVLVSPIRDTVNYDSCHTVQLQNLITQEQWQQQQQPLTLRELLFG